MAKQGKIYLGLRIKYIDRHTSLAIGCVWNWFSLYFYNCQITAYRN